MPVVDNSCIICCQSYNVTTRRPFDLGCGHCVCEQCYNTSKLTICVECRQPTNNPHLQYTLLRMLQPSSPTSFPLGCLVVDDDGDDAPGTPHPSAPAMEVEPWEPDDSSDSSRMTSSSGGLHSSSTGSLHSTRLNQQSNAHSSGGGAHAHTTHSVSAAAAAAAAGTAYHQLPAVYGRDSPMRSSAAPSPSHNNPIPVHALTFLTSTWTTATAAGNLAVGVAAGSSSRQQQQQGQQQQQAAGSQRSSLGPSSSIVSHQLMQLASFPVADIDDLLDYLPESESPTSSSSGGQQGLDSGPEEEQLDLGAGGDRALVVMQGAVASCVGLVQQLMAPQELFEQSTQSHGWPAPGPSLLLAITGSCWRTWSAYSTAMQHTLLQLHSMQLLMVSQLGQLMQAFGLPNCGHLAAYWLATWLLGFLLYQFQLGLQLMPVAAAALGLVSFAAMPGSSGSCLLWPAKLAGAVLAGDCLVLGLLGCAVQQLGLAAGLHGRLLSATPQVLLLALLLLWGQVAAEVLSHGARNYRELKFASLVSRAWCVAAAGVLLGGYGSGPSSTAAVMAAAVPWMQKCHLLLEGPVVVHHLGLLLRPSTCWASPGSSSGSDMQQGGGGSSGRASSSRRLGSASRIDSDMSSSSSTVRGSGSGSAVSALLLCVHCLLQLLLLLFVPPAPLAAVTWLPVLLRGGLVWGVRVLLCGCSVQLMLHAMPAGSQLAAAGESAVGAATSSSSSAGIGIGSSSARHSSSRGYVGARPGSACCSVADDCCGAGSSAAVQDRMVLAAPGPAGHWEMQLHGSSMGYSPAAAAGAAAAGSSRHAYGGSSMAAVAGLVAVLRQHVAYLVLLMVAAAGDSFIMTVPTAAGAVRSAWHDCVRQMLIVMFVAELAVALWHEVQLLRHQHYLVTARTQPRRRLWGYSNAAM